MSSRKIIFIVIAILLLLSGVFALWKISTSKELAKAEKVDSLSVWVVWWTTEQYNTLFSGFSSYKKEYAKTKLDIRVFPDYDQYRRILLSTLADGWGPDIFMVDAGADDILEKKLEPIPEDIIDFSNFEKEYEDIFLSLITSTGSWDKKKQYIKGIPLGYETLGIFYNKSLLLSVPKTWNEVSAMYENGALPNVFPTNIGMGSRFTPFSTDIIASFLLSTGIQSYEKSGGAGGVNEYKSYALAEMKRPTGENTQDETGTTTKTLFSEKKTMEDEKLSTIDLFMRGKIAFVVGYPSLVSEIEKAYKRAWDAAVGGILLTERLPVESVGKAETRLARYDYLALSTKTKHALASVDLLAYLLTETALEKRNEAFPLLISPRRSDYESSARNSLSKVFAKTRLESFIPLPGEKMEVFHYGLKTTFEKIFGEDIDRSEKIDSNILDKISLSVQCEVESTEKWSLSEICLKNE